MGLVTGEEERHRGLGEGVCIAASRGGLGWRLEIIHRELLGRPTAAGHGDGRRRAAWPHRRGGNNWSSGIRREA
uniref:Uncharacterized protein n=1 Tax=Aegilops tauschii TaxID=37682 RepID=M8BLL4_AEGTA